MCRTLISPVLDEIVGKKIRQTLEEVRGQGRCRVPDQAVVFHDGSDGAPTQQSELC